MENFCNYFKRSVLPLDKELHSKLMHRTDCKICAYCSSQIALFMHMFWNTGITAVIFTGIIWLMVTVSYLKNCVVKRKQKLIR